VSRPRQIRDKRLEDENMIIVIAFRGKAEMLFVSPGATDLSKPSETSRASS
jgi:hypothetical protein